MAPPILPPEDAREPWRPPWSAAAHAVCARRCATAEPDPRLTFTRRADRAGLRGRELAARPLERPGTQDPPACPRATTPPCGPQCAQPAQRVPPPRGRWPRRQLAPRAGTVEGPRAPWPCATCRVAFSPPDQRRPPGTEGCGSGPPGPPSLPEPGRPGPALGGATASRGAGGRLRKAPVRCLTARRNGTAPARTLPLAQIQAISL